MKKVLIIIPKGFELLEASAFVDVFGWTRDVAKEDVATYFCGLDQEVAASFGTEEFPNIVKTDILIEDVIENDYDSLALPGGFGRYGFFENGFDDRILSLVRAFDDKKKPIGVVCTAALVLAKSGILANRRATTYRRDNGMYVRQLDDMGAICCDEDVVVSDNVITSSGPSTAPLVALGLVEMLFTKEVAAEVAYVMGYDEALEAIEASGKKGMDRQR